MTAENYVIKCYCNNEIFSTEFAKSKELAEKKSKRNRQLFINDKNVTIFQYKYDVYNNLVETKEF